MTLPWYRSKTVWLNLVTMAIMILSLFIAGENAALLPPLLVPWVAVAIAVLNIILRVWFTSEPIRAKPNDE